MTSLRLGVAAYPVSVPASFEAFAEKFSQFVAQGAASGGELLLLPEYACLELAGAEPGAGEVARELAAVCARRDDVLALFVACARRERVWLAPGSLPWASGDRVRNRAPLISPDGEIRFQDKRVMARFEDEAWGVAGGDMPRVFDTPWGRIGISICYDSEFPDHVHAQAAAGAWLILVPGCTDTLHGWNRVRLSARARALENQCFVAVSPTVGLARGLASLDENHGCAAIFGPVDRGFAEDGVVAQGPLDVGGWVVAALDRARIDEVRDSGAVRNFRDWARVR